MKTRVSPKRRLTDVIIFVALSEFFAEGERRETLEFFGKPLRTVEGIRPVALPADLILRAWFARVVLLSFDQVQGVALHGMDGDAVILVVRTDDIQIFVQTHLDSVILPLKPKTDVKRRLKNFQNFFKLHSASS